MEKEIGNWGIEFLILVRGSERWNRMECEMWNVKCEVGYKVPWKSVSMAVCVRVRIRCPQGPTVERETSIIRGFRQGPRVVGPLSLYHYFLFYFSLLLFMIMNYNCVFFMMRIYFVMWKPNSNRVFLGSLVNSTVNGWCWFKREQIWRMDMWSLFHTLN